MTRANSCEVCSGRAQLKLCANCQRDLRNMFVSLSRGARLTNGQYGPGWLENLTDSALGMTRLSRMVRYTRSEHSMRLNIAAAELLDRANATLFGLVHQVCGKGMGAPTLHNSSLAALWLAYKVPQIASGEVYRAIRTLIYDIKKMVDLPLQRRFAGPCPTVVNPQRNQECEMALMCDLEATEVTCPSCEATHNVDDLVDRMRRKLDDWLFTRVELDTVLKAIKEPVPERTLSEWFKKGKIQSRGYRHDDGRITNTWVRSTDRPVYRLADVRKLRNTKTSRTTRQKAKAKA